jgi:hypothetical protein
VFVSENIEFDKTISLLKEVKQNQIYKTRNQLFNLQHNFFITDLNNNKLIEITDFDENYCRMSFYQEDREDIEFNKGNATKQAEEGLYLVKKVKNWVQKQVRNAKKAKVK